MARISHSHGSTWLQDLRRRTLARWELIALSALLVAAFLFKVIPLLQYPHVGGDPFLHFEYSMALLNGKYSIPIALGDTGRSMQVYYPPLFHLIALGLFMAFSKVDPYTIMKILASAFSALEIVPVYLIVKRISGSSAGGLLASFSLLAALNDYEMLAWGGYANIAGLFFAACVVFAVITDSAVLSAISGTALALTHHLSTVLIVAVLVPYFLIAIWRRRSIPRSLIGLAGAAAIAYLVFYQFALASLFDYYVRLHYYYPVYDQSLYVTPYILEQVGPPLLVAGAAGIALAFAHNRKFLERFEILPIWGAIPTLLAYAYLLGVQWHGVRWIAFIPEPLCVLTGIGLGYFDKRKIVFIILGLLFAIQLLWSLQSYHFDILTNLVQ